MDPGNQGYRSFWLWRAESMQAQFGWEGLFIDNVEASRAKYAVRRIALAKYPNDQSFQAAVEGFLAYIEQSYSGPQHKPILANIISVRDNATWLRYARHLDGAMMESFVTHFSDTPVSDGPLLSSKWAQQISLAENALAQGKRLILVSQGQRSDFELQRYAFASYLLVANGNAAFRYANADSYCQVWTYPDYGFQLGSPLGARYLTGGRWRRDFLKGYVLVNPSTGRAAIVVNP
jgi:hypothetical protein